MKVQSTNYPYRVNQKGYKSQIESQWGSKELQSSQIEMSASSKLLKECITKAKQLDQDRTQKIQAIKEKINAGTYKVSSEAIAKAMIDDGFFL